MKNSQNIKINIPQVKRTLENEGINRSYKKI